jgi:outer membrane biosynthesis protein TonB
LLDLSIDALLPRVPACDILVYRSSLSEFQEKRMSQTTKFASMGRGAVGFLILLLLFTLLLAGCGGEPAAAPTEPPEPTEVAAAPPTAAPTEEPPTPTEVPPEPTATEVPTEPPPTATPTEEPTPEPIDDTACIACHTSEETLQAMATEEEAPEVASEGEG